MITGKFRSTAAGTLDAWHLAQKFASRPALAPAFIVDQPPVNRVIAVPTQPEFIFDSTPNIIITFLWYINIIHLVYK